jgi:hypothetical protein
MVSGMDVIACTHPFPNSEIRIESTNTSFRADGVTPMCISFRKNHAAQLFRLRTNHKAQSNVILSQYELRPFLIRLILWTQKNIALGANRRAVWRISFRPIPGRRSRWFAAVLSDQIRRIVREWGWRPGCRDDPDHVGSVAIIATLADDGSDGDPASCRIRKLSHVVVSPEGVRSSLNSKAPSLQVPIKFLSFFCRFSVYLSTLSLQ